VALNVRRVDGEIHDGRSTDLGRTQLLVLDPRERSCPSKYGVAPFRISGRSDPCFRSASGSGQRREAHGEADTAAGVAAATADHTDHRPPGGISESATVAELNHSRFALLKPDAFRRIELLGVETPSEVSRAGAEAKKEADHRRFAAILGMNELELLGLKANLERLDRSIKTREARRTSKSSAGSGRSRPGV